MWRAVTRLPGRALGLGVSVWGLQLQLLSLGLRALLLLPGLLVCVLQGGRAVLAAALSVALAAHGCAVSIFLRGLAWAAQLAGSWLTLHLWLFSAFLETLSSILLVLLGEQATGRLVQAAVWASRGPVTVVVTFVRLCAHMFFLSVCLVVHVCSSAASSRVRVRVHRPFSVSTPVRVHDPLSLGLKVGPRDQRHDRAKRKRGVPRGEVWKERKPQMSRSPEPIRRREVAPSRSELSLGG